MVLKSDQEESIIALKKAVAIKRQAPTVNIESPVRDSQANGNAERAVRTWARTAQNDATSYGIQDAAQDPDPFPIDDMAGVMGSWRDMSLSNPSQWKNELR